MIAVVYGFPELLIFAAWIVGVIVLWRSKKKLVAGLLGGLLGLLLVAVAIPDFVTVRQAAQKSACITNLRVIQDAKEAWARQNDKALTEVPIETDLIAEGRYLKSEPKCPAGGRYSFAALGQKPTCSLASKGHKLE
jgi:general secretion pathway protein G